ncbi:MAG: SDR family oxidoreductase [Granulosicoccus sp.]|nr:SDR family oxidoreductase [Granulosicoccus sp.]
METGLRSRTILVTGATGGIGAATVKLLMAEGASAIAAGRNREKLSQLSSETGCETLSFDLTSEDEVRSALAGVALYGVVNCGGWGGEIATPMDTDLEVFDKVIDINARGTLLVTKYAAKSMITADQGGSIVNVSSQASLVGLAGHVSYASSKGAVDAMTRVSALELGKHNIRVNAVNPTVVMTPMSEWYWGREDIGGPLLETMPMHKWATEEDCAGPIVFLLSDAAAMISGVCIPIDGGYTAV